MATSPDSPSSNDASAVPAAQDGALVAFADCELIGVNNAMMLVINRANGNQKIMTPQVVDGLKTCTRFKTVAAHAAFLAGTRPELQGQEAMAATALSSLQAAGMLLEASDVCARLTQQVTPRTPAPTRVFIITCDRPVAVERLLDSLLRAGDLGQHDALYLVDDSRETANREANRGLVARFNQRSAKPMHYVGAEVQESLLSGLIAQLPAHEAGIRFLLDAGQWRGRKTYGRSRTLCLLFSVGCRALVMDDDILCEAILPPIASPGIGLGSTERKAAFYGSADELLQKTQRADFDPLSGHAKLLGRTLGQALQTLNKGPLQESQFLEGNAALANVLSADSPILVTQCGSLGDPGTGSAHWVSYLGEDSVERLINAPHGISAAIENRFNWLGSSRPNIFKMPFMSQLTGLDNSYLLPPYFPAFRGEDTIFGAMLVAMHQHGVSLEYPWSVPHLPIEKRVFSATAPIAAAGVVSPFARYLTEYIDCKDSTDPEQNLNMLVQDILRIAARSDINLLLDYRREMAKFHADQLYLLKDQYARTQKFQSAPWQDYLRRSIEEVQRALTVAQSPTSIEGIPANSTEAELVAQFRAMANGFAAALSGWVEMRRVAADLTQRLISSGRDDTGT